MTWYEQAVRRMAVLALLVAAPGCRGVGAPTQLPPALGRVAVQPQHGLQLDVSSPPLPACPEDTFWDGMACAHARVTCGGWDGMSCASSTEDSNPRTALVDYQRIDAEARSICPENDEVRQVYQGTVMNVIRAVDDALGRADAIDRRLEQVREAHPGPAWRVATMARAGSVYDCVWTSLRQANPTLFTLQQQALLQKLQQLSLAMNPQNPQAAAQEIADTTAAVRDKWQRTRSDYLDLLAEKLVRRYVGAAVLARRFALEGFVFMRVAQRLPVVAAILGDETMSRIVGVMTDPTDPKPEGTEHRHLHYVTGAFDRRP